MFIQAKVAKEEEAASNVSEGEMTSEQLTENNQENIENKEDQVLGNGELPQQDQQQDNTKGTKLAKK